MVKSMTGYGRGEAIGVDKHLTAEIKSVNHRFLEIIIRMPRHLNQLEERIKKLVQEKLNRGRVEVYISLEETGEKKRVVKVDKELGLAYYNSLKELAQNLDIPENFDILKLASLPGIFSLEEEEDDLETVWLLMQQAVGTALSELVKMREVEGQKLTEDLLKRKQSILNYTFLIAERSPQVVLEHRERLFQRIQEILGEVEVDQAKLANEIAFFADRIAINEELVRLESHLSQMADIINQGDSVGRKLDFLVQEMNREINTVGSKANDVKTSHYVVDVKSELEKLREQIQNIE